ncbi:MAG: hypothetical protein JO121_08735 [Deltaproteobacteria bacterium]|nr:hypothetical protein [Deltaproteobacteria bacterium]
MRTGELVTRSRAVAATGVRVLVLAGILVAGLGLSGCIWLAIPGLAYTGYQYEKTGKLPGMPSTSQASSGGQPQASAQATPADNNIE